MLEAASFHLQPGGPGFRDCGALRTRLMSAGNISDAERNEDFWRWLAGFPSALSAVLESGAFRRYWAWERQWIAEQNAAYREELRLAGECVKRCVHQYGSPVQRLQIVIHPIKCVYSADCHLRGGCFLFSSGAFQTGSIIHEFLHHVVHPVIAAQKDAVLKGAPAYPGLDASYYLSGGDEGHLNASEEFVVRSLTENILSGNYPPSLSDFILSTVKRQ